MRKQIGYNAFVLNQSLKLAKKYAGVPLYPIASSPKNKGVDPIPPIAYFSFIKICSSFENV